MLLATGSNLAVLYNVIYFFLLLVVSSDSCSFFFDVSYFPWNSYISATIGYTIVLENIGEILQPEYFITDGWFQ